MVVESYTKHVRSRRGPQTDRQTDRQTYRQTDRQTPVVSGVVVVTLESEVSEVNSALDSVRRNDSVGLFWFIQGQDHLLTSGRGGVDDGLCDILSRIDELVDDMVEGITGVGTWLYLANCRGWGM